MAAIEDHVFKALADPTRRAISERLVRWQRNESRNESRNLPKPHNAEEKG